ncbi:probable methyltransferase [Tanacetum coccineum]
MTSSIQLKALLHYATSRITPQQSFQEITVSFDVLKQISPCNFLVFGLGHDSMMWAAFNSRGRTLFLEEDPTWVQTVLKSAPELNAEVVKYRTQLSQADELMKSYKLEPECSPTKSYIKGNDKCRIYDQTRLILLLPNFTSTKVQGPLPTNATLCRIHSSLAGSTSAMEVSIPIAFVLPGREPSAMKVFKLGRLALTSLPDEVYDKEWEQY